MSGESSTEEVLEGVVVGPNGDGVLVIGPESHVDDDLNSSVVEASQFDSDFDESGDKDAAAVNDDSRDQDSSYVQIDRVETSNDSVHTDSDDMKPTDEAGKEDMFVDAPDELGASAKGTNSEETTGRSIEGTRFYEEGGMQSYQLVDEVGHLRTTLEKVMAENSALYPEKQVERVSSVKEIADIHHQIKALTYQHSLVGEHDGGSVEKLHEGEEEEEDTSGTEISLIKYVRECSESLKQALERHLQSEEEIKELHDKLNSKDKEIDDLKAKISQLSLSQESQEELSQSQKQNYLYADAVMNQLLTSLSTVVYQGNLVDDLVSAKAAMVESSSSVLIQNYNQIVYDIEQLRQSLSTEADAGKEYYRTVLSATRDELMVLRAKEEELTGKCNQLEEELAKLKTELEQEKAKSGNLREKLSLAVTKGKGLVQQRDSLKQSLAEKTRELEDCLVKLQDASRAFSASEHRIVELVAYENMLTSLQESISLKDENLVHAEEMLSLANLPKHIQFQNLIEKVKWLMEERSALMETSVALHRIEDDISSLDFHFPGTVTSLDVVSKISWLKESYHLANGEMIKLQDELARTKETELTYLSEKFEGIVQKERHLLEEREDAVKLLLDGSGITNEDDSIDSSTNLPLLIKKYLSRTVEHSSRSLESSLAQTEDFERKITTLYIKDLELTLCLQLLEEDDLERSQFKEQVDELKLTSERLAELRDERDSLQKDLYRAEDKVSTLREKLSIAVKKGKGLVQERELMKGNLDEKNRDIEKLKHEIYQLEYRLSEFSDKISIMSVDLEQFPQLEAETVFVKDQRDQLEKFLEEKEDKLRLVMESVQKITLPTGFVLDNPIVKLQTISSYMSEFEAYKLDSEKELEKAKHEATDVELKLAEAHSVIKSMEGRIFQVEKYSNQVKSNNNELETEKASLEQELQKLMEEAQDQSAKLLEASDTIKSLQDKLLQAEDNVRMLSLEKEEANAGKVAAEMDLEMTQEEVTTQTSKLTEAYNTIRTLEEKLSQLAVDLSILNVQNDQMQLEGKSVLENELQKLKDEINSQAEELVNARSTIKLLEDAASKTDDEEKIANEEILLLSSKSVELTMVRSSIEQLRQDKEFNLSRISKLEVDLQASQSLCDELGLEIENHKANEEILMKKEAEISLLYNNLLSKEQGTKDSHISTSQLKELLDKADGVDFPFEEPEGLIPSGPTLLKKLGFIMDNISELQHKLVMFTQDKQELELTIGQQKSEIRQHQEEILEHSKNIQGSQEVQNEFSKFALHLERVILKLGGADASKNQTPEDTRRLLSGVDKLVEKLVFEYENSKSEVQQLSAKLLEGQKVEDSLSMKVQYLEELIQNQKPVPQSIQERNFAVPSTSVASEITEVDDVDLSGKSSITPVSPAQMRTFRKGSTDHLALNIDAEYAPLISNLGTDEDKGHVFKSLNTTGLIPNQGKLIADRIDGYWVNSGLVLMNQPRARVGVMGYCLVLHLWLLASIL